MDKAEPVLPAKNERKTTSILILSTIVLLGALIRFHGLTTRTMTHIEIYVPGIELPAELSDPRPRFTLRETMEVLLEAREPHPPAYYASMLYWTKGFGTSIMALRLPSVLFGVGSILLIYLLGALQGNKKAALFAAGLLAFNGHHVFWSQLAKSYPMGCFLGLASSALLMLASRGGAREILHQILYALITLLGLATTHYFWPLLATHILWTMLTCWKHKTMPGLLRLQFAVAILGTPLISLAIFQSRRGSYVDTSILNGLIHYLQFGFLFEPDLNSAPRGPIWMIGGIMVAVVGLLLLLRGLTPHERRQSDDTATAGPPSPILWLFSVVAVLTIFELARFTKAFDPRQTRLVVASVVVPVLLPLGVHLIHRYWYRRKAVLRCLTNRVWLSVVLILGGLGAVALGIAGSRLHIANHALGTARQVNLVMLGVLVLAAGGRVAVLGLRGIRWPQSLTVLLAIVPVALVLVFSPAVNLIASRGMLVYSPYLLLVMSQGMLAFARKTGTRVILAGGLAILHILSIQYYRHSYHEHCTDYKALAEQWIPEIKDSDLIFVQRHWITTPIFYYLKDDRFRFVGEDYAQAIRKNPGARVWAIVFVGLPMNSEMEDALKGLEMQKTIKARGPKTILYCRSSDAG